MKKMYEGKAKILFDDGVEGTLIQKFKDDFFGLLMKRRIIAYYLKPKRITL